MPKKINVSFKGSFFGYWPPRGTPKRVDTEEGERPNFAVAGRPSRGRAQPLLSLILPYYAVFSGVFINVVIPSHTYIYGEKVRI